MNETEKNVSSVQIEERKRAREKVQLFLISAASVMVFLGVWEIIMEYLLHMQEESEASRI